MKPLDGCYAKVRQAEAHAQGLHREIRAFAERHAVRIGREGDPETGDYVFRVKVSEEPPLLDWGIRAGDVLHNLHSALDHLAYLLATDHLGRTPTDQESRAIFFPIALTRQDFDSLQVLRHLDPAHVTVLRGLQPYHRGDRARAGHHTLAVLKSLSNIDKHRVVHMSYVALSGFPFTVSAVRDCEITRVIQTPGDVPLVDGQELARVQGVTTGPEPEIEGKAKLSGRIALSDGTPLQELLDQMGRSVRHVIDEFAPHFP